MSITISQNRPGLKYDSYKKDCQMPGAPSTNSTLDQQQQDEQSNLWAEKKNLVMVSYTM
jgi:hypothetical protein